MPSHIVRSYDEQLRKLRLNLVKVEEAAKAKQKTSGAIPMRDVVIFTRQFSTMINSGLPLVQALDILSKQTENKTLSAVTRQVVFDVESGHTVADALAKHPKAFSDLYVNMVQAGETGGILDTILQRLSTYMEKMMSLKRKIKGAMIYPATIITVGVVVTMILLVFVIPVFAELFNSFGKALHRCVMFGVARADGDGLAVRQRVPLVAARHLARMPYGLQVAHRDYVAGLPAPADERTRANRLAEALVLTGDDPDMVERHLLAVGISPLLAEETSIALRY